MDRIKFIALVALPALISLSPSAWFLLPRDEFETKKLGVVEDERVNESSGVGVSRVLKGGIWTHNDSGDSPRLFLLDKTGKTKCVMELKDARATDWEDMCSFEMDGKNWLLVGDTGDNQKDRATKREKCRLYLVEEPKDLKKKLKVKPTRTIKFEYEDGPHDCEGLAVDVKSKTILLLTKTLLPGGCHLYEMPLDPNKKPIAKRVASLPVPIATAMDLSPDGKKLVVLNPRIGFIIERKGDESWDKATRRGPRAFKLPRTRQAEAICFSKGGKKLFVTSEGVNEPFWEVRIAAKKSD